MHVLHWIVDFKNILRTIFNKTLNLKAIIDTVSQESIIANNI